MKIFPAYVYVLLMSFSRNLPTLFRQSVYTVQVLQIKKNANRNMPQSTRISIVISFQLNLSESDHDTSVEEIRDRNLEMYTCTILICSRALSYLKMKSFCWTVQTSQTTKLDFRVSLLYRRDWFQKNNSGLFVPRSNLVKDQ